MPTDRPRPLRDLIGGPDTAIGRLLRRRTESEALTDEVRRLLPGPLRPHVVAASLRDDILYVVTDAAVWAARLRFHAGDIRTSLGAKQGRSLQKVQIRVAGGRPPSARPQRLP